MNKLIIGLAVLTIGLTSCKKEGCTDSDADNYDSEAKTNDGNCIVSGCTDVDAVNFLSKATKDNGTCKFEADVVFWYTSVSTELLASAGAEEMTYEFAGNTIGTFSTSTFWNFQPDCGQSNTISILMDLGSNKSATYPLNLYYKGSFAGSQNFSINANQCNAFNID